MQEETTKSQSGAPTVVLGVCMALCVGLPLLALGAGLAVRLFLLVSGL